MSQDAMQAIPLTHRLWIETLGASYSGLFHWLKNVRPQCEHWSNLRTNHSIKPVGFHLVNIPCWKIRPWLNGNRPGQDNPNFFGCIGSTIHPTISSRSAKPRKSAHEFSEKSLCRQWHCLGYEMVNCKIAQNR